MWWSGTIARRCTGAKRSIQRADGCSTLRRSRDTARTKRRMRSPGRRIRAQACIPHSAAMLDPRIKPSAIARHLDEYVIGQDDAKKILAVAVYAHYRKIAKARAE